jgi:hypothetical protein
MFDLKKQIKGVPALTEGSVVFMGATTLTEDNTNFFWNNTTKTLLTNKGYFSNYIDFAEISTPSNPPSNEGRLYSKDIGGVTKLYFLDSTGTDTDLLAGAGGGEANTASNQGVGGVGFFDNKNGVDLEFRNLTSINNKITVALDAGNKEVDLTLNEGNVIHDNLSGSGTNTHAQIDTHIASTSNPHTVTKSQVSLGNVTDDAQLKRSANDFNSFTLKGTPVSADVILIEDSADTGNKKYITVGSLPSSGESNTASNQGSGTSIFYQKSGVDLQFNAIKSENNRLSVALDAVSHDVELTVNEANIVHQNISGAGTNTHAQIDTHLGSSSNPHTVTKTQVGLSNVPNTDCTDADNISDGITNAIITLTQETNFESAYTHSGLTTGNPHSVNKTDIGLSNVPNIDCTDADNISDGATNAIITLTQETNFETAFSHTSNNDQAHTDYLKNNAGDTMQASVAGALLTLDNTEDTAERPSLVIRGGGTYEHHVQFNSADNLSSTILDKTQLDSLIAHLTDTGDPHSITWSQVDKATSDIADITTRSHTSLTDIGTNSHANIDTHISASNPHSISVGATGTFGTDNVLIKSDSTGRLVQATGISVDDSNNITGIINATLTGKITLDGDDASSAIEFGDTQDASIYWNNATSRLVIACGGTGITIGDDTVTTLNLFFDTTGFNGSINWVGSTDYFQINDDIMMPAGEDIYFRDTALYITSDDDGHLDFHADISIDFNQSLSIGQFFIDINEMTTPSDPSANVARIYCRDSGGTTKLYFRDSVGTETDLGAGAGGGEANTMSSQGSGTSLYYQKDGVDLQLNAIKSENDRLTVALDGVTHDVELTVNEGNIVHQNISGAGTNDHSAIDTHISATNPHTNSVGSSSTFGTDNVLLRSDGTGRLAQATGITIDDSNNVTGVNNLITDGYVRVDVDLGFAFEVRDDTNAWSHLLVSTTAQRLVEINSAEQDIDFIVNGQSVSNLIYVDASVDTVGFGTNTPDSGVLVHIEGETYIKATQAVDNSFSVTGLYVDSQLTATSQPKITSFRSYLTHSSVSTGGSAINNLELKNVFTGSNDSADSFCTYYNNEINTTSGNYTFNNLRGNQTLLLMNSACTGTHTIIAYRGIHLTAVKVASPTATFSGTDWYQIDVGDFGDGAFGGTLTNAYGIYFAEQTYATNNYEAFFEGGGEIFFRDSAIHIGSLTDGHLDLTADIISVDINTPDIDLSNQATDILMKDAETNSFVFKNQSSGFVYLTFDTSGGNIINNVRTIIDSTNAEVFLIRKESDTGDVFAVDTSSSIVAITGSLTISTALDEIYGGTGQSTIAVGDLLYGSASNVLSKLAKGTKGQHLRMDDSGTNIEWSDHLVSKSFSLENPTASEDKTLFFTNRAITITEMRAVLLGTASPSVTWTIRHQPASTGQGRDDTGNEVVTSGTTTTSITSGDDVTSFNDATIPADSFVWLETTAQSGTVNELHITIYFRETTT